MPTAELSSPPPAPVWWRPLARLDKGKWMRLSTSLTTLGRTAHVARERFAIYLGIEAQSLTVEQVEQTLAMKSFVILGDEP